MSKMTERERTALLHAHWGNTVQEYEVRRFIAMYDAIRAFDEAQKPAPKAEPSVVETVREAMGRLPKGEYVDGRTAAVTDLGG